MCPRRRFTTAVVAACLFLWAGDTSAARGHSVRSTDAVLDWNAIMVATVASQNAFAQARFAAITQLAVFEAVNSIDRRYRPYLDAVAASPHASQAAAAIAAAHTVLRTYFPAAAATLDAARVASLAQIPDSYTKIGGRSPWASLPRRG